MGCNSLQVFEIFTEPSVAQKQPCPSVVRACTVIQRLENVETGFLIPSWVAH